MMKTKMYLAKYDQLWFKRLRSHSPDLIVVSISWLLFSNGMEAIMYSNGAVIVLKLKSNGVNFQIELPVIV